MEENNMSTNTTRGLKASAPHVHPLGPWREASPGKVEGGWLPVSGGQSGATVSAAYAASNASMPLSASAGLVVRRYRRVTMYRTSGFDGVVRLVAVLLHRIAVSSRGSVCYLNGRRMRTLLSLSGTIHPIDLSVIYSLMEKLGFDVVKQSRGKYVVIRMDKPIMREIKNTKTIEGAVEVVKRYLGG
jgi:hypothetical protein